MSISPIRAAAWDTGDSLTRPGLHSPTTDNKHTVSNVKLENNKLQ